MQTNPVDTTFVVYDQFVAYDHFFSRLWGCDGVILNCFMLKAVLIILFSWHSLCNLKVAYATGLLCCIVLDCTHVHDIATTHPGSYVYRNITLMLYMLLQEPCSIQLANLQWHAGPIQAGWRTAHPSEEDHLPPGIQPDDLWLWHCTAGAQWATEVQQHHPTHLPTRLLPRLPCRHALLGHRLGRAPRRRYFAGIGDSG